MLRLGLCCVFHDEPEIKFRRTTVQHLSKFEKTDRLALVDEIVLDNALTLKKAIAYCAANQIGCFRVNSQIWPVYTHKTQGYTFEELPRQEEISAVLSECRSLALQTNVRLAMHPDQFVVLNSRKEDVVAASIAELEYQARFAEMVGVDVINVHGGGAFGNKTEALVALAAGIDRLSERARSRLTLENDDVTYTPADLLPFCEQHRIPFVYDVHHHRCTDDVKNVTDHVVRQISERAINTWMGREPLMHISSPVAGWNGPKPRTHHSLIDFADFPDCWKNLTTDWTLEVEARHKEIAVGKLRAQLTAHGVRLWSAKLPIEQQIAGNAQAAHNTTGKRNRTLPPITATGRDRVVAGSDGLADPPVPPNDSRSSRLPKKPRTDHPIPESATMETDNSASVKYLLRKRRL